MHEDADLRFIRILQRAVSLETPPDAFADLYSLTELFDNEKRHALRQAMARNPAARDLLDILRMEFPDDVLANPACSTWLRREIVRSRPRPQSGARSPR